MAALTLGFWSFGGAMETFAVSIRAKIMRQSEAVKQGPEMDQKHASPQCCELCFPGDMDPRTC